MASVLVFTPKGWEFSAQGNALGPGTPQVFQPEGLGHECVIMPQSLARVLVHLVFGTKNREPLLAPDHRERAFAYLAGTLNVIDCPAAAVGGVADHVHLLFVLGRTVPLSKAVEELKKESSKWMKVHVHPAFYWQNGYGAFSVSPSNVPQVTAYIQSQDEHHRVRTFQDEFRELLQRHGIEWDERYVWD